VAILSLFDVIKEKYCYMEINFFVKSHGLGNDYVVIDSQFIDFDLTDELVKTICDVHFGIGSDGILLKVPSDKADFGLKIYNPDASVAEKSGNGLRIFSKFLFDYNYTKGNSFSVETDGGLVHSTITKTNEAGRAVEVKVDMGKAEFKSANVPVLSELDECLQEELTIGDKVYLSNCVSVGNPHCVIVKDEISAEEACESGPQIETHARFPNKINVQFVKVLSKNAIQIEIWERGAGYTLASGSSSCAAASVSHKLGLVGNDVTVKMPGGELSIQISDDFELQMTGAVAEIASGILSPELIC